MPYSSSEGKDWIIERVLGALDGAPARFHEGDRLAPRLLDVGAGSGTYAELLAAARPRRLLPYMTAIEVHAPYVERFGLRHLYDEVVIGDAREIEFPQADVVVLGDVLEHMPLADAVAAWGKARRAASTAVLASLPVVPWPQGECEGNPHEAHVETWTHERVMGELCGIRECWRGAQIGCYRAAPLWGEQ